MFECDIEGEWDRDQSWSSLSSHARVWSSHHLPGHNGSHSHSSRRFPTICFKKTTKSVFKLGSTSFEFKFEGVSPVYEEKHLKVYSESEEVAAEN